MTQITPENISKFNSKLTNSLVSVFIPIIVLIIYIIYAFIRTYYFQEDIKTKSMFECSVRGINIIVDKSDGWSIKDDYFIKGKNKISINLCKVMEDN